MTDELKCVSCGHFMPDQYCGHCGEQRLSADLRSVKYIIKDLFTDLTSVDSKLWQTLKTLFLKPGYLDYDYHIGRRVNYLKPITIFLLINVLFVMFSPITDFYVNFYDQLNSQGYSPYIKPIVENYITEKQATLESFGNAYNQLVTVLARSLIILQVPVFALLVALVCWRKNLFSGDYLIYALNFHSWLLVWIIFSQLPAKLIGVISQVIWGESLEGILYFLMLPLGFLCYLWLSAKRLFQFSFWHLLWRVPILLIAFAASHFAFRFIQLLITVALVKV